MVRKMESIEEIYVKGGKHTEYNKTIKINPRWHRIFDELPRGFSNMVMQDCKSIPKSTISQSIPS